MQDWAPQAMLFGLAIDLALIGTLHLRLWKDNYRFQLLSLVVLLILGAVGGLIWSDLYSPKAEKLLVVYEAVLPAFLFAQLARFMPTKYLQWVLIPVSAVVVVVAFINGWGFQSSQMFYYELIILIFQIVLVCILSVRSTFTEQEPLFILGALALLLVFGPGYGLLWSKLEINTGIFAIVGSAAGALIVVGRLRSSFLHFNIPMNQDRKRLSQASSWSVPRGIQIVPKERYDEVRRAFEHDVKAGRVGLWISMDPASYGIGHKKGVSRATGGSLLTAQLTHSSFVDNALDPMRVESIKRSLSEFLKMTGNGMVFIKDLHYIVSNSDIWQTTELLKFLREKSTSDGWSILVGADLLDSWELENLRKAQFQDWA